MHPLVQTAKHKLGQIKNPFELPAWWEELKDRDVLRADLVAGLTVALILIPQSMAYAQLAGLPPHYGLYASLLPPIFAAFFGSSRQLATGPVAMVSLMTAAALEPLATAGGDAFIGYAVLLAFMVGLFQLVLGLFRLGVLLNFLSHPVVLGFVNAAAIIIATSQLGKIFGVTADKGDHHYEFVINTVSAALERTHWPTLLMAIIAFAIMYGVKRYRPALPSVLIAVAVTTVLAWLFGFAQHSTVRLDQISDQKIRIALVYDAVQSKHLSNNREKYIEALREYELLASDAEREDEALMRSRQQLEQVALRLEQLEEESQAHHAELFGTPLYAVGKGGEHEALYPSRDRYAGRRGQRVVRAGLAYHQLRKQRGRTAGGRPGYR